MSKADDNAWALQDSVRESERNKLGQVEHSKEGVRQAIVHTREDIVLFVSHLSSLNKSANKIVWRLNLLLVLLIVLVVEMAT